MAVNITSTSDGGTYTCQVTVTEGQEASGNFTLRVTGTLSSVSVGSWGTSTVNCSPVGG